MKVFVDLESLQLIEGPGFRSPVNALRFKRGDAALLEVAFLDGGTTQTLIGDAEALELRFGIKPRNRYDVGYLVHTADWTMPEPDAEKPVYQCSPSFNTVELDSALGVGSSTGSELSEILLMGEITWREGEGLPTSTRTFPVIVENDVNRGTEGVPTSAEPAYPAPEGLVSLSTLGNHAVRFDLAQSLSDEQKAQARANIGAGTGGGEGTGNVVFRGGWDANSTYAVGDWVSFGHILYRNVNGNNNITPYEDANGTTWAAMTARGVQANESQVWSAIQDFRNTGIQVANPGDLRLLVTDQGSGVMVQMPAPDNDSFILGVLNDGTPTWISKSSLPAPELPPANFAYVAEVTYNTSVFFFSTISHTSINGELKKFSNNLTTNYTVFVHASGDLSTENIIISSGYPSRIDTRGMNLGMLSIDAIAWMSSEAVAKMPDGAALTISNSTGIVPPSNIGALHVNGASSLYLTGPLYFLHEYSGNTNLDGNTVYNLIQSMYLAAMTHGYATDESITKLGDFSACAAPMQGLESEIAALRSWGYTISINGEGGGSPTPPLAQYLNVAVDMSGTPTWFDQLGNMLGNSGCYTPATLSTNGLRVKFTFMASPPGRPSAGSYAVRGYLAFISNLFSMGPVAVNSGGLPSGVTFDGVGLNVDGIPAAGVMRDLTDAWVSLDYSIPSYSGFASLLIDVWPQAGTELYIRIEFTEISL